MWRGLSKTYPPQFELIPLFLLLLAIYLMLTSYVSLPDRVPTHFNGAGLPDAWGNRGEIFVFPILGAVFYLGLTAINLLLANAKDPRQWINLPQKRKALLTKVQIEKLRVFLNRSLFTMKSLLLFLMLYSLYLTIEVALGKPSGLSLLWFLLLAAIMGQAVFMAVQSFRLTATPR